MSLANSKADDPRDLKKEQMAKQMKKLNVAMLDCGFTGRAHSNAFIQSVVS